jgi:hypothetical protein
MSDLARPLKDILRPLVTPIQQQISGMKHRRQVNSVMRAVDEAYVDPVIRYPSYKSFDQLIDVPALQALDGYIRERLADRHQDIDFWTGPYTQKQSDNQNPGSRIVELTQRTVEEYDYYNMDKAELWAPSPAAGQFAQVMAFIRTLPFKSTGRMMIMYDFDGRPVTAHRDHHKTEVCNEFIWFRTNFAKPFFMMNHATGERKYVEGHTAWFDSVNQFHGADAAQGLSISLRVDGVFSDELRARIPKPPQNAASTASYWASVGDAA